MALRTPLCQRRNWKNRPMVLARRLASGPPIALRYMKENFTRAAMGGDVIECLDLEATHHVHAGAQRGPQKRGARVR